MSTWYNEDTGQYENFETYVVTQLRAIAAVISAAADDEDEEEESET